MTGGESSSTAVADELDRTILHFARNFPLHRSVEELKTEMVHRHHFDAALVHEVVTVSTIAFGRALFEGLGIKYSPVVIRAHDDGTVEEKVPLSSLPAYTRARALVNELHSTMPRDAFRSLCLYNAESRAILKAIKAAGQGRDLDVREITLYPVVVPDSHVTDKTMACAFDVIRHLRQIHRPIGARCRRTWRYGARSEQHV